jgi:multicomponent Na+:H+ antiporter subunit E
VVLSGKLHFQYLAIGAVGSLIVAAGVFPWNASRPFPVFRFFAFIPWHLWQILISNLRVAKTALAPRSTIAPQFVRVAPGLKDERALTVLGCAITLTPGTLTLDVSPESLYVHALDADSADDIRKGTMARKVAGVFAS